MAVPRHCQKTKEWLVAQFLEISHRVTEAEGSADVKKEQVIKSVRVGENSYKNFIY